MHYTKEIYGKMTNKIKSKDKFSHAEPLTFFNKRKNGTIPGGCLSFLLGFVVIFLSIDDIRKMLLLSHNHLTSITTQTNFE